MASPLLTEYPELSHLSREDLEDLLNDPAYFQAFFHSLPRVKAVLDGQVELGLANETVAKSNLSLQERLYALRQETNDAFTEAKSLEARWAQVDREQKELYQRYNQQFLLMRLRHATTAQDDASEALASSFVQHTPSAGETNGKDVDDFVKEFKELRKTYHKRVMWGDKWAAGKVLWRDD
ncbi:hypothetical protein BD410DRAFT_897743 [Rickenella mellea]|uniref:VPS37 C-terminal domain-containing protein n=1 Tax=Rickenella mellea TaxID=50990 RepID=A0A4Y7Q6N1_9AGAM|nr:hypothetical protein BD410DRAFT_897743 [Rickenella mellea]